MKFVGFFGGVFGLLTSLSFITITEFLYLFGIRRNEKNAEKKKQKLRRIMVKAFENGANKIQL